MTRDPMDQCKSLVDQIRNNSDNNCILRWVGSKIPRGATIGGVEVGWAQHGRIVGKGGEELGFYKRMQEWGGPAANQHAMLVTTRDDVAVIAPDGSVCK